MVDAESVSLGEPPINFFQVLTAMAYAAFAEAPVDVAIVEVGLGGAWDSTNVADGQVAVLTPISLDHQRLLGGTLAEIATEKSGIIKPGAIGIIGAQPESALAPIRAQAAQVEAQLIFAGEQLCVHSRELAVGGQVLGLTGLAGSYDEVYLPLHGAHQAQNLLLAVAAVEAFLGGGSQPLDADLVRAAAAQMSSPGRIEIIRSSPTIIVDAAHNPAGAGALADTMESEFHFSRLIGVVGVLTEKDADGILAALESILDEIVITQPDSPRAIPAEQLAELAEEIFGLDRVRVEPQLAAALSLAVDLAEAQGDLGGGVLATGSVTMAAGVRGLLGRSEAGAGV